jgi:hypothetical protein
LLPVGLALVFAFHVLLAVGVVIANRPAVAFAVVTAFAGIVLAAIGGVVGLPMPWPLALGVGNLLVCGMGIQAWRETGT